MKNALSLSISMIALGLSAASPAFAADEADSLTAAIAGGDTSALNMLMISPPEKR